jgi:hypothetical protein
MQKREFDEKAWNFIQQKLEELRNNPLNNLRGLPRCSEIGRPEELEKFKFWLWKDELDDGSLLIVIQGFRDIRLWGIKMPGGSKGCVDGFLISPSGVVSDVPKKYMYEYM